MLRRVGESLRRRAEPRCVRLCRSQLLRPVPRFDTATVRLVFMGSTTRRTNLPASAQACLNGVGATHTHPSWRSFAAIPLQSVPPDRYQITFTDVPVNTRVSFR